MLDKETRAANVIELMNMVVDEKVSIPKARIQLLMMKYKMLILEAAQDDSNNQNIFLIEELGQRFLEEAEKLLEQTRSISDDQTPESINAKNKPPKKKFPIAICCVVIKHLIKMIPNSNCDISNRKLAQAVSRLCGHEYNYTVNYLSNPKDIAELGDLDIVNDMLKLLNIPIIEK